MRPRPLQPKAKECVAHTPGEVPASMEAVRDAARTELAPFREQVADIQRRLERMSAHVLRQQARIEQLERQAKEGQRLAGLQRSVAPPPHSTEVAPPRRNQRPDEVPSPNPPTAPVKASPAPTRSKVPAPTTRPVTHREQTTSRSAFTDQAAVELVEHAIRRVHKRLSEQGRDKQAQELAVLVEHQSPRLFCLLKAVVRSLREGVPSADQQDTDGALVYAAQQMLLERPSERYDLEAWLSAHELLLCRLAKALGKSVSERGH